MRDTPFRDEPVIDATAAYAMAQRCTAIVDSAPAVAIHGACAESVEPGAGLDVDQRLAEPVFSQEPGPRPLDRRQRGGITADLVPGGVGVGHRCRLEWLLVARPVDGLRIAEATTPGNR